MPAFVGVNPPVFGHDQAGGLRQVIGEFQAVFHLEHAKRGGERIGGCGIWRDHTHGDGVLHRPTRARIDHVRVPICANLKTAP